MVVDVEKIKQKIDELETMLKDYRTALRVFEAFGEVPATTKPAFVVKKKPINKISSIGELVLKDIREKTGDISTSDLVAKHMERTKSTKKKAQNAIYVALSDLKKRGKIESYKFDPKMNGSYFKIKNPE
jgi:type II secretory pathway component PulC